MVELSNNNILIVGAGLGGLALAQGLKKQGIPFSILERESQADERSQGYRIKIFPDSIPDLQYLLTPELWKEFEETCAETVMVESNISAIDTQYIARRALRGPKPYTVDRGVLRKVLLQGLEGEIQWGKEIVSYHVQGDREGVTAKFRDGSEVKGKLLVAADGGNSPIRKQYLPNFKIIDPKGCCIYGKTPFSPELSKKISPRLLHHLTLCRDTATVIQEIIFSSDLPVTMFCEAMRFSDASREKYGYIPDDYIYWAMLCPSQLVGFTNDQVNAWLSKPSKELGLMITSEWDPSIRCLIELQDEYASASMNVITTTPDLVEWEASPHVTIIGDAAHVMSPAGGVGAATALKDAATLTKELVEGGVSVESIRKYESAMRAYASGNIERSMRGGRKIFGQPPIEQCKIIQ